MVPRLNDWGTVMSMWTRKRGCTWRERAGRVLAVYFAFLLLLPLAGLSGAGDARAEEPNEPPAVALADAEPAVEEASDEAPPADQASAPEPVVEETQPEAASEPVVEASAPAPAAEPVSEKAAAPQAEKAPAENADRACQVFCVSGRF